MKIIYLIVKYFTVVGTFSKAFFEHLACRISNILIEDGRYFRANEMCGHVEHEIPSTRGKSFTICFLPFLLNLIVGLVFALTGGVNIFYLGEFFYSNGTVHLANFAFLWIGISCLTNLFPEIEDVLALKDYIYGVKGSNMFVKIIAAPIFAILYGGAYLEKFGITFLTAIGFTALIPTILSSFLPQLFTLIAK
ncbi:MAG: hypothetical protein RR914_04035 [Oscillospiraceae bacterium]